MGTIIVSTKTIIFAGSLTKSRRFIPDAYPYTIFLPVYTHILVHTQGNPLAVFHDVRTEVRSVDPDQQVEGGHQVSLEQLIKHQQEWQQGRLVTMLLGAFSLLGLVLAVVGLYSVVSYSVLQRTNEFGIRIALGAQRSDVLKIVFASATVSVGSGLVAGIFLSLTLTKLLVSWAEATAGNPIILLGVTLLLVCCSALACFLPARHASFVDPAEELR